MFPVDSLPPEFYFLQDATHPRHGNIDLIDVQYLKNVVFSIKNGSNFSNHSSSDSPHPIKKVNLAKFSIPAPY